MILEPNALVKRVSPSQKQMETAISLLDKKLTADLQQMAARNERKSSYLFDKIGPFLGKHDFPADKAATSISDVQKYLTDEYAGHRAALNDFSKGADQLMTFSAHVDQRLTVTGPPYDAEWTTGAIAYAHKDTGEFGISPMNSYAAAAVGIYITSSENTIGQISPYAPITYSWFNWVVNSGFASSNGGTGVLIYDLTESSSIPVDYRATLWNNTQAGPGLSNEPETNTYLSYALPGELLFPLYANRLYLAWVWCWGWNNFAGDAAVSMSSISCKMPFAVIRPRHL